MMNININDIPTEPSVTIIDPNGIELITTNNPTEFQYIRLQIKKNKLEGYKIITCFNNVINILSNGKLDKWIDDEIPGYMFDRITQELI